jgi:hypothetical protein
VTGRATAQNLIDSMQDRDALHVDPKNLRASPWFSVTSVVKYCRTDQQIHMFDLETKYSRRYLICVHLCSSVVLP